jgi:hypothetical protein
VAKNKPAQKEFNLNTQDFLNTEAFEEARGDTVNLLELSLGQMDG